MAIFRMIKTVSLVWGAYRTYRRYRNVLRSGTKVAMKRARRVV